MAEELIPRLSGKLTQKLGKGFSKKSLEQYRKFYVSYKEIAQAVLAQSLETSNQNIAQILPAQLNNVGWAKPCVPIKRECSSILPIVSTPWRQFNRDDVCNKIIELNIN